jgi:hypothetical protein
MQSRPLWLIFGCSLVMERWGCLGRTPGKRYASGVPLRHGESLRYALFERRLRALRVSPASLRCTFKISNVPFFFAIGCFG